VSDVLANTQDLATEKQVTWLIRKAAVLNERIGNKRLPASLDRQDLGASQILKSGFWEAADRRRSAFSSAGLMVCILT
jgi:hypothetical protein